MQSYDPQVVNIIESRARGLDLLTHNYYELLYAFHIGRHNYRKGEAVYSTPPPTHLLAPPSLFCSLSGDGHVRVWDASGPGGPDPAGPPEAGELLPGCSQLSETH